MRPARAGARTARRRPFAEGRDLFETSVAKGEHVEREGQVPRPVRIEHVDRRGRLPVRASQNDPQARRRSFRHEPRVGDLPASTERPRARRHRERRIVGQQIEDPSRVTALKGVAEPLHYLTHTIVADRASRRLLAPFGDTRLNRLACSLQGAVDGRGRGLEGCRYLLRGKRKHVPEDQHSALTGREVLQSGDEREFDGFPLLVSRFRRGADFLDRQNVVGIWLEPGNVRNRALRPLFAVIWRVVDGHDTLRSADDRIEARVRRDAVEPGANRAASVEAVEPTPAAQQRLLHNVIRIVKRPEHPVRVRMERPLMARDQAPEGLVVACTSGGERLALVLGSASGNHEDSTPAAARDSSVGNDESTRLPRVQPRGGTSIGDRNPVVHLELRTSDLAGSCRFLTEALGWRAENLRVGDGSYVALDLGRLNGGVAENDRGWVGWSPYVEVHDIRQMTERAVAAGASVILPPREGPVGWRSILAMPSGSEVALWQPKR
jgi:predicted enzyme related to lactoylglutathione lyase